MQKGFINSAATPSKKGEEVRRLRFGFGPRRTQSERCGKATAHSGPSLRGWRTPAIPAHACALRSSRLQQDGGGQVARGRSVAAGNPAAAGGSCGRRPGSSGPRLARCCAREALLVTAEEGEAQSCLPGLPAPRMYASLGSGLVAALRASAPPSTLGSWSSGSGSGCVPQESKRPSGVRTSCRGASVWQVSETQALTSLARRCSRP